MKGETGLLHEETVHILERRIMVSKDIVLNSDGEHRAQGVLSPELAQDLYTGFDGSAV